MHQDVADPVLTMSSTFSKTDKSVVPTGLLLSVLFSSVYFSFPRSHIAKMLTLVLPFTLLHFTLSILIFIFVNHY